MLSFIASASLSLNIGSSAVTSARAAPSMVAAMETSFVYSPPAPLGTTSGEQYPNTVRTAPVLCKHTPSRPAARARHTTGTWACVLDPSKHYLRALYSFSPTCPRAHSPTAHPAPQAMHSTLMGVMGKVVPTNMNKSPKFLDQDFLYGVAARPGVYALQCTPPSMGENRRSWQAYHAPY